MLFASVRSEARQTGSVLPPCRVRFDTFPTARTSRNERRDLLPHGPVVGVCTSPQFALRRAPREIVSTATIFAHCTSLPPLAPHAWLERLASFSLPPRPFRDGCIFSRFCRQESHLRPPGYGPGKLLLLYGRSEERCSCRRHASTSTANRFIQRFPHQ